MGHIISVLNQKGGVGKTTTAINVAAQLAKTGKSVLLIDLDPQGDATSGLGFDKHVIENGTYEVLLGTQDFATCILETQVDNLYLLPTNENLAAAEIELVSVLERERALQRARDGSEYYDNLIDCLPSLSLLTINPYTAPRFASIPGHAEH